MDFENLISQLLMASGMKTKSVADEKHAVLQQQLARPMDLEVGPVQMKREMDLDVGPVQMRPNDFDVGPVQNITHPGDQSRKGGSVSHTQAVGFSGDMQGLQAQAQHDRTWAGMTPTDVVSLYRDHPNLPPPGGGMHERDAYAQLDKGQGSTAIVNPSSVDHMPVILGGRSAEADNHAYRVNDIAAMRERGQEIPAWMYQGLQPHEIVEAHRSGSEMDGYRQADPGSFGEGRPFSPLTDHSAEQDLMNVPVDPHTGKKVMPVSADDGSDGVYRGDQRPGDAIYLKRDPVPLEHQLRNRTYNEGADIMQQRMQRLMHILSGQGDLKYI